MAPAREDRCYFFGEYTPRAGWQHSDTNQLIANLKKRPSTRRTHQWGYKLAAIQNLGQTIARSFKPGVLSSVTFIPIPPSKPADQADYDDRMTQVARATGQRSDVREVLFTRQERESRHTSAGRRDPNALRESLGLHSELLLASPPIAIVLLDDVLTTGCSFTFCKDLLLEVVPEARIIGFFAARRIIDHSHDFYEVDVDGAL